MRTYIWICHSIFGRQTSVVYLADNCHEKRMSGLFIIPPESSKQTSFQSFKPKPYCFLANTAQSLTTPSPGSPFPLSLSSSASASRRTCPDFQWCSATFSCWLKYCLLTFVALPFLFPPWTPAPFPVRLQTSSSLQGLLTVVLLGTLYSRAGEGGSPSHLALDVPQFYLCCCISSPVWHWHASLSGSSFCALPLPFLTLLSWS